MYYNPPSFSTLPNLSSLPPHQLTPHVLQLTVLCHFPIQAIVLFSHELGSIDADTILDEYRMREKLENRIQAMKHRYRYDTILIRWYSKTQQNRIWIRVYKWSIFIIINHLLDIWNVCVCVYNALVFQYVFTCSMQYILKQRKIQCMIHRKYTVTVVACLCLRRRVGWIYQLWLEWTSGLRVRSLSVSVNWSIECIYMYIYCSLQFAPYSFCLLLQKKKSFQRAPYPNSIPEVPTPHVSKIKNI